MKYQCPTRFIPWDKKRLLKSLLVILLCHKKLNQKKKYPNDYVEELCPEIYCKFIFFYGVFFFTFERSLLFTLFSESSLTADSDC